MGSSGRHLFAAAAVVACLAGTVSATAQDVAAAEALFDRGLRAMEAGDFATGCPAIEESYRLDPRPGTLFTLAECENKRGRTATAATRYEDYLGFFARLPADQQMKQGDRAQVAASQRDRLRAVSPKLTLSVTPSAGAGAVLTRDGVVLARPSWGIPLPVDPGEHLLRLEVAGHEPSEQRIRIAEGESKVIELAPGASNPSAPPPGAVGEATPPPTERADRGLTGVQAAGLVVGGIGVVGLAVGAVFGLVTLGHANEAEAACPAGPLAGCADSAAANQAVDAATTPGAVSTIGFAAGGALLVGGVIMLIAGGDSGRETGSVAPALMVGGDGGVIGARGRF
jgi:hypothetical protein